MTEYAQANAISPIALNIVHIFSAAVKSTPTSTPVSVVLCPCPVSEGKKDITLILTRCHARVIPRACALSWVCEKNYKKNII